MSKFLGNVINILIIIVILCVILLFGSLGVGIAHKVYYQISESACK